jgi:uncharacterized protein (TIGR02118 family)
MYKLINMYFAPKDPAHFRKYYKEVHVPMGVHPLIKRRFHTFDVSTIRDANLQIPSDVFCYWEAEFENKQTFEKCLSEMQHVAEDTYNYATGGFFLVHFEVPKPTP